MLSATAFSGTQTITHAMLPFMLIIPPTRLAQHLQRSRDIAQVLARHGFNWLLGEWDLGGTGGALRRWRGYLQQEPHSAPKHVRLALEELGPTFIKLGQALSTRPDLVPAEYLQELSKLQDAVTPVPYAQIAAVIERELGLLPEQIFTSFEKAPKATASIAQVHRAHLGHDCPVVVKVQRPGVAAQVAQDLAILSDLAALLARRDDWGDTYDFQGWVDEFALALEDELDYTLEGRNADRVRRNFEEDPTVHIPQVFWDYTTPRVLVQEEVRGLKISDLAAIEAAGLDPHRLAATCARVALVQIFKHGFYHADPHPGNFFVEPDGALALIDFGQMGRLDAPLREMLVRLMMAISRRDADRLVDELLALGVSRHKLNRQALKRDLDHVIHRYSDRAPAEISGAQLFTQITNIALQHRLQLPAELTVLAKVVVMDEGLGAHLDPDFRLMEFAQPYFEEFWLENLSPAALAQRLKDTSLDVAEVGQDLPRQIKRLLLRLERGEITFGGRWEESRTVVKNLHRAANRISLSILLAGAMIGLSRVFHVYRSK